MSYLVFTFFTFTISYLNQHKTVQITYIIHSKAPGFFPILRHLNWAFFSRLRFCKTRSSAAPTLASRCFFKSASRSEASRNADEMALIHQNCTKTDKYVAKERIKKQKNVGKNAPNKKNVASNYSRP